MSCRAKPARPGRNRSRASNSRARGGRGSIVAPSCAIRDWADLRHLALRLPPALVAALDGPGRLTAEEERQLPNGYAPPSGGFESYSERLSAGGLTSDPAGGRSYRAQVARQQFAADKIVRHLRAAGALSKLLVFLEERDLEAGLGVPRYVAQKLQVRQVVLDSSGGGPVRPKLLTRRDGIGRAF